MKNTIYISLFVSMLLSCCESQKTTQETNTMDDLKFTSVNTYKIVSDSRVKDDLKKMDTQYIYDYEVVDAKTEVSIKAIENLKDIINDDSNFLDASVIRNCSPDPEFFIETDSETVYGFFLSSNCPTLFLITYDGPNSKVEEKSISNDKIELFKELTNKILQK